MNLNSRYTLAIKQLAVEQATLLANQASAGILASMLKAAISTVAPINPHTVIQFVKHMMYQSFHDALLLREVGDIKKGPKLSQCPGMCVV